MVTTDHHEVTRKNLRKGKLDIILMTIFLACFFEYSQLKIIDLPAAEHSFKIKVKMPAIRQTFVNCICIKVSAEGLQTNDIKVLKLTETAVENGFDI